MHGYVRSLSTCIMSIIFVHLQSISRPYNFGPLLELIPQQIVLAITFRITGL